MPKQTNKRAANRRVSQNKAPVTINGQNQVALTTPIYRPIYKFARTITGTAFDVVNDGINPSLYSFQFTLNSLPNPSDFTGLFDMFRFSKIEIDWVPEYTELTDAAPLSNAVNVRFNSAIDLSDNTAPVSVDQVLQYQNCVSTGITKPHRRSWMPSILLSGAIPCHSWVPSASASTAHLGIKVAVPPCGVSMTFRARVKIHLECANVY